MPNILVEQMPEAIRHELENAGAELSFRAGATIPQEDLGGAFVFVVEAGVASKFLRSETGLYSEIGMVGREGMFPVCGLLRVAAAPHTVISQVGELRVRRIRAREFHAIISESPEAELFIRKYVYAFLTQVSSNILTSEQDLLEKRVARWLLMCHDRIDGDTIPITHEMLALMTSAQRPTVTNIVNDMRAAGMIDLARGRVQIKSRPQLHRCADGAYGLSEQYWRDHLGPFGRDDDQAKSNRASSIAA
jgi:CRP-like cAMP-binding protein